MIYVKKQFYLEMKTANLFNTNNDLIEIETIQIEQYVGI